MSNTYSVYKHTNKINGKVYIGITVNEPEIRWGKNGKNYERQLFGEAIQKYGWDNFEHEVLFTNLSRKEANDKEIELISLYNATNRELGYNVALGGTDVGSCAKAKIVYKYSMDGQFIDQYVSVSEAARVHNANHRAICRCCLNGINHFSNGFRWSYEYLGEQIAWELMRNNNFYQEVYCYDLNGTFLKRYETVTMAQNDTGINNSAICGCYNGKTSNTKGLRWFTEYKGEKIEPLEYEVNGIGQIYRARKLYNVPTKPVYQYSPDGCFIAKYKSASEAAKILKVANLNNACLDSERHGYKTYGYYWSYSYHPNGFKPSLKERKMTEKSMMYKTEPVYQYDNHGNFVREFPCVEDAAKYMRVKKASIMQCCKNNRSCKKYYWSFLKVNHKDDIHVNPQQNVNRYLQFDMEHNLIAEYKCPQDAMKALNVTSINFKAKTSRGYIWEVVPKG